MGLRRKRLSSLEVNPATAQKLVVASFPNLSRPMSQITKTIWDWFPDATLDAPTDRDLVRIAKLIPPRQWSTNFDCDDFALEYYYKVKQDNPSWAIGLVNFENTPAMTGVHRMCVAVANVDGRPVLRIIEPQKVGSSAAAHLLRKPSPGYVLRGVIF